MLLISSMAFNTRQKENTQDPASKRSLSSSSLSSSSLSSSQLKGFGQSIRIHASDWMLQQASKRRYLSIKRTFRGPSSSQMMDVTSFGRSLLYLLWDLDNALESNHFQVGRRSKIIHQSPSSRTKVDEKDIKGLLKRNFYKLRSLDGDSRELRFDNAASPHRKSMPARPHHTNVKNDEEVKRGSVYQSSREVRSMRKLREGRRNVEPTLRDDAFISFEIVDSLPESSSPLVSLNTEPTSASVGSNPSHTVNSMEFLELSFRDLPESCSKLPETDANVICERETVFNLSKSFSAKAAMPSSERETFKPSPKSLFSPFRRMLDPIMKSKSMRNPSFGEKGYPGSTIVDPSSIKRQRMFHKSLLSDRSKAMASEKIDCDVGSIEKERVSIAAVSSPVHLHAILKLECKHGDGALSYEFAVKDHEDVVLMAKTWRTNSAFNWVYTFHSCSKNKNTRSPPVVGQMQVSCYLCSDVDSSIVTEFVLYDIAQARRSFAYGGSPCPSDSNKLTESQCRTDFDSDPSTSSPQAPADLHPQLETAAIVIQVPFGTKNMKSHQTFSSIHATDRGRDTNFECMNNHANVKVVTCSGTHGTPSEDEVGPSSLLDRWRVGGGCDCGGWDMACPIFVFDKLRSVDEADYSGMRSQQQMVLFVQGRKEKISALSIVADGKGQYSVDFHAQLSALQAFSICISILHSSEAASALGDNKNNQSLYSNSLKLLLEEEVRHLIEAVAESEEERKAKKSMKQQNPPSFILDPPFSPMGRV